MSNSNSCQTPIKLSSDDIVELLGLYKEHESLYNTLHPQHSDKSIRRSELKKLLQELKEKDIHIPDIVTLKKKIKSLKDTYRTVRVKIETSKKNASEEDDIYKPTMKWYSLADSYLRPFVTSQLVQHDHLVETIMKDDADDSDTPSISRQDGSSIAEREQTPKCKMLTRKSSQSKRVRINESDDESNYYVSTKLEKRTKTEEKPDVCEAFATYVAMQMRSLPRSRQLILQSDIQNAILKQFMELESEGDQIESTVLYMP